jgi:hypothetical protein
MFVPIFVSLTEEKTMSTNDESIPEEFPPLLGEPPATQGSMSDEYRNRLQRILEYVQQKLADPICLASNIGGFNAGLQRMALWLENQILQLMARPTITAEVMAVVDKSMGTHLRLMRQIASFSDAELRAVQRQRAAHERVVDEKLANPDHIPSEDSNS